MSETSHSEELAHTISKPVSQMGEHTPGPWVVDDAGAHPVVRGADFTIVAVRHRLPREVHEANARLIAAAPELLEALQQVVSDIRDYERVNNLAPSPGKQDCWQSVTRARAAIAKATGER